MILFITTRGHEYTLKNLVRRTYGAATPLVKVTHYDRLFRALRTISATHIFCDIERLYPWELRLAAEIYSALGKIGIKRLNDPAKVKCRYELLRTLYRQGFNPFNAYRADDEPRPERFPVFLRNESDHGYPLGPLIESQPQLDERLRTLRATGTPLRGVIVIEYCSEPMAPNLWQRFGTYSVAGEMHVDHSAVEDTWNVKYGKLGVAPEWKFEKEREAIITNRYAEAIRPAFEIANIEYGRADHSTVGGKEVVYEVNTNPGYGRQKKQFHRLRDEAFAIGRPRFAELLWRIDSGDGSPVSFRLENIDYPLRRNYFRFGWLPPQRP